MASNSANKLSLRLRLSNIAWPILCCVLCGSPAPVLSQQLNIAQRSVSSIPVSWSTEASAPQQQPDSQTPGSIRGTIIDQSGATIAGAQLKLTRGEQQSPNQPAQSVQSDENGQFFFANIPSGPFQLTVTSEGLAAQTISGTVEPGKTCVVPQITLAVATQLTEVRVGLTPIELAQEQVKEQEKQRVLGFIPNFYVSYVPDAAPLTPNLKFRLAWKSSVDPVTFAAVGAVAGIEQAGDRWGAYGQGVQGYAKRFGASYADVVTGTFIGSAILPTLLKQDPRYFYNGKGSKRSRILYALANSVICKGDNGHWQPNYSNIGGNLAAGGISNLYYPPRDRNGAGLVFSNTLIRLGEIAVANIFQEFFIPKLTPNRQNRSSSRP
jgi:hypothetical protein